MAKSEGDEVSPADGDGEDGFFYNDQDDAQSFIQPAISAIATRLTSPKTPALEKAAAMEEIPEDGMFGSIAQRFDSAATGRPSGAQEAAGPRKLTKPRERPMSLGPLPPSPSRTYTLPTPWQAGPREMVVQDADGTTARQGRPSATATQPRHRRSSSVGADALKRLSRALPSLSDLLPNISASSFFSTPSSQKTDSSPNMSSSPPLSAQHRMPHRSQTSSQPSSFLTRPHASTFPALSLGSSTQSPPMMSPTALQRAVTEVVAPTIRKPASESDDSLLYHSLSRVSSFGDDDRWEHIRDQVNSRFKAIKDSFDPPTFRMLQLPNILPAHLKRVSPGSADFLGQPRPLSYMADPSRELLTGIDAVLPFLTGDIVIMGGYRGSVLRSAEPPHRQLWVPVKVGLNIRKVNLEVGLDPEDEETMESRIFASGMLQNIGPVDISRRLFKRLRECDNARSGKLKVHDFGYDWRLSPHLLSRTLIKFLEGLPSNQAGTPTQQRGALVVAHSLGGVLTRHAVNERPELFSGVVYAGAPQRCVNILGPMRNGDAVLLNEKVLTAQVNFSLRTSFALLPDDGFCFIDKKTKEEYPVDFFDPDDWIKYRLSPCIEPPLPPFVNRLSTLGSLLSDGLSSLPLRSRSSGGMTAMKTNSPARNSFVDVPGTERSEASKDRTLAPQTGGSSSVGGSEESGLNAMAGSTSSTGGSGPRRDQRERNLAYLTRTLAEVKRFRLETLHRPEHTAANAYPPLAVIYGKDTPTVCAARVACREAIACADAYDDLVFRSGDGVVLAREAMLPVGYDLVRGGRISTDRGHVTILGDLVAVGRALEAVVRGREKGIGLGAQGRGVQEKAAAAATPPVQRTNGGVTVAKAFWRD